MPEPRVVTAAVVIIGNEVLSGRTQDANIKYIAERLTALGVRLMEVRVVRDDEAAIIAALDALRRAHDYVFTTGGIGPTHDDITSACIAKAFGRRLHRHPDAVAIFKARYTNPADLTEARLRMTEVPEGATLIDNPISGAPGFQIENVFVMAGIPRVMQAMFEGIVHRLVGGAPLRSHTVSAHTPEGIIAAGLTAIQAAHPDLEIGSYPFYREGRPGTSLVVRGTDTAAVATAAAEVRALVRAHGEEPVEDRAG